ncbi:MAG: anti-sigma factor antagonist [Pedosphaera sp.]|nr:anti-sigma factor antagonist [Pedosphaera sp.]
MKIQVEGENLNVSEVEELGLANSNVFGTAMRAALPLGIKNINIDLSKTDYMDCSGLGALVALHNIARNQNGDISVNLANPAPQVQQMFELTRMDQFFPMAHA